MAKRTNYSFEKRQKDLNKKQKKEEKLKRKLERKAGSAEGKPDGEAADGAPEEVDSAGGEAHESPNPES